MSTAIRRDLKASRGFQPGAGRRERSLRPICRGHRSPSRSCRESRRRAASRVFIPTGRRSVTSSAMSERPMRRSMRPRTRTRCCSSRASRSASRASKRRWSRIFAGFPAASASRSPRAASWCKELDPKPDRSGQTVQLTIDQGCSNMRRGAWASSRAPWSRWTVTTGDILAFVSMPAFDPNSFSEGIGRARNGRSLSEDDHIPLLNKVAQGLYPSGSTIKPAMALALPEAGHRPKRRVCLRRRLADRQPLLPLRRRPRHRWTCARPSNAAATPISGRRA